MPTVKAGKKQHQVVLDEHGEAYETILAWAQARGLTMGVALRCIATDWSDAMNGKPSPFTAAIAAAAGMVPASPGQSIQTVSPAPEPAMSAEEKIRRQKELEAAEQFL